MKQLIFLLLIPAILFGQYVDQEDFEGTGLPTGTGTYGAAGTYDWDATDGGMFENQSLKINSAGLVFAYFPNPSNVTNMWYYFAFKVTSGATLGSRDFFKFVNGSTLLGQAYINANQLYVIHGTANQTSAAGTIPNNTVLRMWIHYTTSTGTDGIFTIYIGTTAQRPETPVINITNGTNTSNVTAIRLYGHAETIPIWVDEFIYNAGTEITDVQLPGDTVNPPTLFLPGNGATGQLGNTKLQWNEATVDSYNVVVANNSGFSSPSVNAWTDTLFYDLSGLSSGTTYYWKVRGKLGSTFSDYTTAWTFTTASAPVSATSIKRNFGGYSGYSNWLSSSVGTSTTQTLTDSSIIFALSGASAATSQTETYTVGGNLLPEMKFIKLTNNGTETVSNIRWQINDQYDFFNFTNLGIQVKEKFNIDLATASRQDSIDSFADVYYNSMSNAAVYGTGPPIYVATADKYNVTLRSGIFSQCGPITTARSLLARAAGFHIVGVSFDFGGSGHIQGGMAIGDSIYAFENLYYQGLQYNISGDKSTPVTIWEEVNSDTSSHGGLFRAQYGSNGKNNDNALYDNYGPGRIASVVSTMAAVSWDTLNLPNPTTSGISLRSGESIYLDWRNLSPSTIFTNTNYGSYNEPLTGAQSKYVWRTKYVYPVPTSATDSLVNTQIGTGLNTWGLSATGTGSFVLYEYHDFAVNDGYVTIKYQMTSETDSINVYVRQHNPGNYGIHYNDGKIILPHPVLTTDTTLTFRIDSLTTFPSGVNYASPRYHLHYEIQGDSGAVGIESMTNTTYTFFNPLVFSHLEKGANTINWYYDAGTTKNVTAEFGYIPKTAAIDTDSVFVYLSQDTAQANGMNAIDARIVIKDANGNTIGGQTVALTSDRADDDIYELRLHNVTSGANSIIMDAMNHPNTTVTNGTNATWTSGAYKYYSKGSVNYTLKSWSAGTSTYTLKTDAGATLKTFTVVWTAIP